MEKEKDMTMGEMMDKAQRADFVDLLQKLDIALEGNGRYRSLENNRQTMIDTEQNAYMDFQTGQGGSPVAFSAHYHKTDTMAAVKAICELMEKEELKEYYTKRVSRPGKT